jgi:hypothetical protein
MPDFGRWTSNGGDPSLNEINRTDRFLDALANQQPVYSTDPSEAELAQLLAGWRDEVRTPPLMSPVTPRDAVAALTRAVESRKRTRTSVAVVGSVAAAVLCLGGFGAVVAGAGPGDALYGLHTMLFGEPEQTRTDHVALASQQLAEVQQLIDHGQWQAAQDKLQAVTTTVATVNDVQQKQQLVNQWQQLTVKVDAKDANATLPPGAPPPEMPAPAIVDQGTTTTPPTTPSTSTTAPSAGTSTTTTTSPSSGSSTTTPTTTSPSKTTTSTTTTSTTTTTTSVPVQLPPPTTTTTTAPPSPATQFATPPPTTTVTTVAPTTVTQFATPPPSTPSPTPSTPLPTPSAQTPLPTPSAQTPLPTPPAVQQEPATTQPPAPKIVITTTTIEAPRQQGGPR